MDDLDPEKIRWDIERMKNHPPPPSDASLRRSVRIDSLLQRQTDLRLRRQLPGMTPEQEADTAQQLLAVDTELTRLLAEESEEQ